jgi:hypothetical protein
MPEFNPDKITPKSSKTIRQWIGFAIVLCGASLLLLESVAILKV